MRFWIFIFFVLTTHFLNAQNIKTFEDMFGIQGEIRSQENFSQTQLPEKGTIDIRWREVAPTGIKTYRVQGRTQNHLPAGKWIWEEAHWNYTLKVGNDIRPLFDSKGNRKKWEGNFVNGKPDGKWNFISDSISSDLKTTKVLLKMDLTYKNGIPTGVFAFENNQTEDNPTLKGTLDKDGIATGTWVYQYTENSKKLREERIYKEGLLTKVRFTEGDQQTEKDLLHNNIFLENRENSKSVIGEILFEKDEFSTLVSDAFFNGLHNHFANGWKLEVFPYEVVFDLPKFKQLKYPLTAKEENDLQESKNLIRKQRHSIENLLTDNVYIHRSRNIQTDTAVSYLQLHLSRINYVDSLLSQVETPMFLYKNRSEQAGKNWIKGLNDLRFAKGEVYDSAYIHLNEIAVEKPLDIFGTLKQNLTDSNHSLPKYFEIIENTQTALKRAGELKVLEDQLVQKFMLLQSFYSEQNGIGKEIYEKWIKGEIQNKLQEYSQAEDYEEALTLGKKLTEQLDILSDWKEQTEFFDSMENTLKSHYTYMAYNPYTGINDIEIVRKRRFLNNILQNMFPYMRTELSEEQHFDQWKTLWKRQFAVYHFLVEFASRDDSQANRLERRIRTDKKPERILKNIMNQIG